MDERRKEIDKKTTAPKRKRISVIKGAGIRRHRTRLSEKTGEKSPVLLNRGKLLQKLLIAAGIIALVVLLKSIQIPFTEKIVDEIRGAITYEVTVDDALGKLKYVSNSLPDIKAVFGSNSPSEKEGSYTPATASMIPPTAGTVVGRFNQTASGAARNLGIDIAAREDSVVYSVADGIVAATGRNEAFGDYIKIEHGNDLMAFYMGCSDIQVSIGHKVKQGDRIAGIAPNSAGDYILHFEVWDQQQPVNPLPYFRK